MPAPMPDSKLTAAQLKARLKNRARRMEGRAKAAMPTLYAQAEALQRAQHDTTRKERFLVYVVGGFRRSRDLTPAQAGEQLAAMNERRQKRANLRAARKGQRLVRRALAREDKVPLVRREERALAAARRAQGVIMQRVIIGGA